VRGSSDASDCVSFSALTNTSVVSIGASASLSSTPTASAVQNRWGIADTVKAAR